MNNAQVISTVIVAAIISAACFFLNVLFPVVGLIVLYFAMRSMFRTVWKLHGLGSVQRSKWLWVIIFAAPYPIAIVSGAVLQGTQVPDTWESFFKVAGLFTAYTLLTLLFSAQIMRSLKKAGTA